MQGPRVEHDELGINDVAPPTVEKDVSAIGRGEDPCVIETVWGSVEDDGRPDGTAAAARNESA
ncbi:MAG: hypothetical protein NVS3B12_00770 [Acidimicrobiales bacterium]